MISSYFRRRLSNRNGASLIELILASFIIGIAVSMITILMGRLANSHQQASTLERGRELAREQLEALQSKPFANLVETNAQDAPGCACESNEAFDRTAFIPQSIPWGSVSFERRICIVGVQPQEGHLAPACGRSTGLKEVTVRVVWKTQSHPYSVHVQALVQDPAGPEDQTHLGSARVSGHVVSAMPGSPNALSGVHIYALNVMDGHLIDQTQTDEEGKFEFSQLAPGTIRVAPQVERWQRSSPSEQTVLIPKSDSEIELKDTFAIRGMPATITIHSNRSTTLVIANSFSSELGLPTINGVLPGISATVVPNETALWEVPEGSYWTQCWARDDRGHWLGVHAIGGENALWVANNRYDIRCQFPS